MLLLQHRLPLAVVAFAFAVTAGVFVFARPEYRDPTPGKALVFKEAKAPVDGWTWEDETPGFTRAFGAPASSWS